MVVNRRSHAAAMLPHCLLLAAVVLLAGSAHATTASGHWTAILEQELLQAHTAVSAHGSIWMYGGLRTNPTTRSITIVGEMWRYTPPVGNASHVLTSVTVEDEDDDTLVSPGVRSDSESALLNGHMHLFGGFSGGAVLADLWAFNFTSQRWAEVDTNGTQPTAVYSCMMDAIYRGNSSGSDGQLLLFGGRTSAGSVTDELFSFDSVEGRWAQLIAADEDEPWPAARSDASLTTFRPADAQEGDWDCVYLFGGQNAATSTLMSDLWRFCPDTGMWTELSDASSPPSVSNGHTAVMQDERLLVYGGYSGIFPNDYIFTLREYDALLHSWLYPDVLGTAPSGRTEHIAALLDGSLYIHGGRNRYSARQDMHATNYTAPRCPGGQVSPDGSSACVDCQLGFFSAGGDYNCTACPAGTYSDAAGAASCTACPAGTFSVVLSATNASTCEPCPAGSISAADGSTACADCPAGTYTDGAGQTVCLNCTAGTASALAAAGSEDTCQPCPAGFFSLQGAANCTACPAGHFNDMLGSDSCEECLLGQWAAAGSPVCTDCDNGYFSTTPLAASNASCLPCPSGQYGNGTGASDCLLCPVGFYSNTTAATSLAACLACPLGTFSADEGAGSLSDCADCPAGTYGPELNATVCVDCPIGTFSTTIAAVNESTCLQCPSGSFSATTGNGDVSLCDACPPGSWSQEGSTECTPCDPGTFSPATGATDESTCERCPHLTYSDSGAANCTACEQGTHSYTGWAACYNCSEPEPLLAGYVRNADMAQPGSDDFAKYWSRHGNVGYLLADTEGYALPPALRVLGNAGLTTGGAEQRVEIEFTNPLRLTARAWSKALSVTGSEDDGYALQLVVHWDSGDSTTYSTPFSVGTHDWEEAVVNVPPRERISAVDIVLRLEGHGGDVWFDDASLIVAHEDACACELAEVRVEGPAKNRSDWRCLRCPTGYACGGGASFACFGELHSFGGQSSCSNCLEGWICQEGFAFPCTNGTYMHIADDGTRSCESCPVGHACAGGKIRDCPPGKYGVGTDQCLNCLPGSFSDTVNAVSCTDCDAGFISNFVRDDCVPCPRNHYNPDAGGSECLSCPTGKYSTTGSQACLDCDERDLSYTLADDACNGLRRSTHAPDVLFVASADTEWQPLATYDCPPGYDHMASTDAGNYFSSSIANSGSPKVYANSCGWDEDGRLNGEQRLYFRFIDSFLTSTFILSTDLDGYYDPSAFYTSTDSFAGIICQRRSNFNERCFVHMEL
eukprot:PLAT4666.1.p1 GENE.PLAT4666.1~~PLAT4666.1.p1  ORF type:complete len:1265 (-),score=566.59 PLAT4666.1:135-3875(-)